MIVRRLEAFVARMVAALGWRSRTSLRHEPVAVSAVAAPRAYHAGSNWLEDGRRLRGRPTPRPTSAHPPTAALRDVLRDPHWTSAFEAGRLARPLRPSQPLEERAPQESLRPSLHLPAAPSESTHDAAGTEDTAEVQRRLLLIRELVRRGLYNEGFKPGYVPEQYRPRPTPPGASPSEPPPP